MKRQEFSDHVTDLVDEHFPKGECRERGAAIVLIALITIFLTDKGLINDS